MKMFDPFVLPFITGVVILFLILFIKFRKWIIQLPKEDKTKLRKNIWSKKAFGIIGEIVMESLFHRRIFKVNPLLGFMHMSLAFGWFLLIVFGMLESKMLSYDAINWPWEPIFLKFFIYNIHDNFYGNFFSFMMDFLLLWVLSAVTLALIKRIYSRIFGMKKTTKHTFFDKLAITTLWFIFPLRLLAESFTSAIYQNGGFLTRPFGNFLDTFLPAQTLAYLTWWAYSIALFLFFISLPFSRYMHIPAEILLIALRKLGIKTEKKYTSFTEIEVQSCPRCGICLDKCQLATAANIPNAPSVYMITNIRNKKINAEKAFNCLLCGRCKEFCPVGIDTLALRITQRKKFIDSNNANFDYLKDFSFPKSKVLYFAGCMTHLTPAIYKSMLKILNSAKIDFQFMDDNGTVCCGRPLMMSGKYDVANKVIEFNKRQIINTEAELLVTSCPICLKVFKDEYQLPIQVMHHSQYILQLANEGKIQLTEQDKKISYHDPCELGRGCGIYEEPRLLIKKTAQLQQHKFEKEDALCCGGSLGNIMLSVLQKDAIHKEVIADLTMHHPDAIVTACPLCKKTITKNCDTEVIDIAELVAASLTNQTISKSKKAIDLI